MFAPLSYTLLRSTAIGMLATWGIALDKEMGVRNNCRRGLVYEQEVRSRGSCIAKPVFSCRFGGSSDFSHSVPVLQSEVGQACTGLMSSECPPLSQV
jgi:hypothetical protein